MSVFFSEVMMLIVKRVNPELVTSRLTLFSVFPSSCKANELNMPISFMKSEQVIKPVSLWSHTQAVPCSQQVISLHLTSFYTVNVVNVNTLCSKNHI